MKKFKTLRPSKRMNKKSRYKKGPVRDIAWYEEMMKKYPTTHGDHRAKAQSAIETLKNSRYQPGVLVKVKGHSDQTRYPDGKEMIVQRTAFSGRLVCYVENNPVPASFLKIVQKSKRRSLS